MANPKSIERIRRSAQFLSTPAARAARGYLAEPLELALSLLDVFDDGRSHSIDEIAKTAGINKNTTQLVIKALHEGGCPLQFTYSAIKTAAGRKPMSVAIAPAQK